MVAMDGFSKLLLTFFGMFCVVVVGGMVMDWHGNTEYMRGVAAGRKQVLDTHAAKPKDCVAWWFQGDPVRADRNLTAACAARKAR